MLKKDYSWSACMECGTVYYLQPEVAEWLHIGDIVGTIYS